MEKRISVGDLVMVVRCCCDAIVIRDRALGAPWRVKSLDQPELIKCRYCWRTWTEAFAVSIGAFGNGCVHAPLSWLKRIPPISELEGQRDASGLDVRQPSTEEFERMVKKMQETIK